MKALLFSILLLVVGYAAPTVASVVQVDEPAICLMCHSDIEDQMTLKHRHTAFEGGKCSDCHNPHAAKHAALLDDEPGDLCLKCHEDLQSELRMTTVHQPAQDGECLACHDPHASNLNGQLKEKGK